MEQQNTRLRNAGFATFFFSGICAISAGVVVSLLQERYGFAYGMTGTLLSLMSIGNLLAGLLMGMLPSALGMKRSVLLLTIGYAAGYAVMGLTGAVALLAAAFFVVGIAKGSVINTCTILVSDHSADRTRGSTRISGIKHTPCRQQARKVARPALPTLWKVMLATTITGCKRTAKHW